MINKDAKTPQTSKKAAQAVADRDLLNNPETSRFIFDLRRVAREKRVRSGTAV